MSFVQDVVYNENNYFSEFYMSTNTFNELDLEHGVKWWGFLSQEEKKVVVEDVNLKYWIFEHLAKDMGVNLFDSEFSKHSLFKTFLEVVNAIRKDRAHKQAKLAERLKESA